MDRDENENDYDEDLLATAVLVGVTIIVFKFFQPSLILDSLIKCWNALKGSLDMNKIAIVIII